MAGPKTCHSLCRTPFSGGDEPVKGYTGSYIPIKKNESPTHTSVMSRVPTPALALLFSSTSAPAVPVTRYTNKDLFQATMLSRNFFIHD